jgi:H+/Cl- antiporter ClcA
MLIHIHSPATPDSPLRWMVHGVISLLFSLFGGVVGAEGPAAEFAHAAAMSFQARSARWFEQRRRSDAATAVSAAVAATFHAPFAAILLPLELGMGGRTLGSLLSALTAYLSVEFLSKYLGLEHFDTTGTLEGFHFSGWTSWILPAVLGGVVGVASIIFIKLTRYSEDVFHSWPRWIRPLIAGAVIAFVAYFYKPAHAPSWMLLEDVFWSKHSHGIRNDPARTHTFSRDGGFGFWDAGDFNAAFCDRRDYRVWLQSVDLDGDAGFLGRQWFCRSCRALGRRDGSAAIGEYPHF